MKRYLIAFFLFSSLAFSQAWPGSVVTNATIPFAVDHSTTTLSANITSSSTTITVTSSAFFAAYQVINIDAEQIQLCSVSTGILNVCPSGRGYFGTTAASHTLGVSVFGYVNAGYHNTQFTETQAIETWLTNTGFFPSTFSTGFKNAVANVTATTATGVGSVIRTVQSKDNDIVSVKDYGAFGDGAHDDTVAISTACIAAFLTSTSQLYFPSGIYIISSTPLGCVGQHINMHGAGAGETLLDLTTAGTYLIDDNQAWTTFHMDGLRVYGGAGAIRNRFTGVFSNGLSRLIIDDNIFQNYTGTAISANSSDNPNWQISRNQFFGANTTTSIGVALEGFTDDSVIERNMFWNLFIGVKLQYGNRVNITNNSFEIQFGVGSTGTGRVGVWIIPLISGVGQSSHGLTLIGNAFGSEGLSTTDYRVLYADENPSGTYFGDRLYATTASIGYITSEQIGPNEALGATNNSNPFVYSFTPNIQGVNIGPITIAGFMPSYLLQFDSSIMPLANNQTTMSNLCGPVLFQNQNSVVGNLYKTSNGIGACNTVDPLNEMALQTPEVAEVGTTTGEASFALTQSTPINSYTPVSATIATISDSAGGLDAITATYTAANGTVSAGVTSSPVIGVPLWLDFELEQSSVSPLSSVVVSINWGATIIEQRLVAPPVGVWKHYLIRWVPKAAIAGTAAISFIGQSTGQVNIGHVKVYQSYEPLSGNQFLGKICFGGHSASTCNSTITGDNGFFQITGATPGSLLKADGTGFTTGGITTTLTCGVGTHISAITVVDGVVTAVGPCN